MSRSLRKNPAKRKRGRPLTNADKEVIIQAYAVTGNKSAVERITSYSRPTIVKVIKEAETNRELQKARQRALDSLAGQVHGKAVEVIDSIAPSDLESGRELIRNDEGQVVRKVEWGPSLLQKVTAAAILTDKVKIIAETKRAIAADNDSGAHNMPSPSTVQEALRTIGNKVARIRALDIQFQDKQPELSQRLQDAVTAAQVHPDIEEADYREISPEDFYEQSESG